MITEFSLYFQNTKKNEVIRVEHRGMRCVMEKVQECVGCFINAAILVSSTLPQPYQV